LGCINFVPKAEPAVEPFQPARPALNWSALESQLNEISKPPSASSSELAIEPHVTLAHDPHGSLEQLNALHRAANADRRTAIDLPAAVDPLAKDQAEPTTQQQTVAPKRDPFDMLSYLAAIPSKQS
jgi:hypothetical protein